MGILIVSYSLTGNNDLLADSLAKAYNARHERVVEANPRSIAKTAFDMLLGRTPRVTIPLEAIEASDTVIFVAPVWMGRAASPLRSAFKAARGRDYAFVSISGGADGPGSNRGLAADLGRRLGRRPLALVDMHIADLLAPTPEPTRNDTSAYRVNERDLAHLTARALAGLRVGGVSV